MRKKFDKLIGWALLVSGIVVASIQIIDSYQNNTFSEDFIWIFIWELPIFALAFWLISRNKRKKK